VSAIFHHISLLRLLPRSYFKIRTFQPNFLCSSFFNSRTYTYTAKSNILMNQIVHINVFSFSFWDLLKLSYIHTFVKNNQANNKNYIQDTFSHRFFICTKASAKSPTFRPALTILVLIACNGPWYIFPHVPPRASLHQKHMPHAVLEATGTKHQWPITHTTYQSFHLPNVNIIIYLVCSGKN